ncbi:MAG: hypothetical protein L6V93_18905 [Clostridiales bacterium]|nr:MAG: hypothetical protein L6V93_18905 [Clostridiales bacterium]
MKKTFLIFLIIAGIITLIGTAGASDFDGISFFADFVTGIFLGKTCVLRSDFEKNV